MTISELICRLQSVKCEHGDLPVVHESEDGSSYNIVLGVETYQTKELVIAAGMN